MTNDELAALELRVSRGFDLLMAQESIPGGSESRFVNPEAERWFLGWKKLLAQYEIYLTTNGLAAAPGGEWEKREV